MNRRRPRILYLSSSWPHDRTHGGQLRALHLGRALQDVGDVTLLVVSADTDIEAARRKSAEEFEISPPIHPRTTPVRGFAKRLRWAFDPRFLNVHGCAASAADRQRVISMLPDFDLVWVLNARTPSLLQIWRWPHTHLDIDDVPSTALRMAARTSRDWVARCKARTQHLLLRRRERRFADRFTTLSVCSEADRAAFGGDRVHVIPNGFARPTAEPVRRSMPGTPRLGFIGLYSYPPNHEGIAWFLNEVWPAIRNAVPGIRFRLAGQDTDGALQPRSDGVDALGWLDDPASEIATWSAMIIPIRIGGGTRIKIADAFSRKCPVVATRFGAFGYDVAHGKHLLLADDPAEFARACIQLVRDPDSGRQLAETAWRDFLQYWTWDAIAPKVRAAAADCLQRSARFAAVRSN